MKKQKKDKRRQSTQQLMGIKKITDYCISTDTGDLVFYIVRPSNLGVLPANAIYARIEALKNVLSTQANIELLALNSRESFTQNRAFYHDRLQQETNPEIRRLLEQDRQHLDEMQVEMKLAREFYLVVRLKNEKRETVYSLLSTIEESLHKSGLPVRRAGREDLKRILALYFEENNIVAVHDDPSEDMIFLLLPAGSGFKPKFHTFINVRRGGKITLFLTRLSDRIN